MNKAIAIAGGSGAGKTFLANRLKEHFGEDAVILSYDRYYLDQSHLSFEERCNVNYDDPIKMDGLLYASHVASLKEGKPIEAPRYDFATHTRCKETDLIAPAKLILCEGIHVLSVEGNLYDFIVFVDTEEGVRLYRRIARDTVERGRTEESVRRQFARFVKPAHDSYVEPRKSEADFVLVNNRNDGLDYKALNELLRQLEEML